MADTHLTCLPIVEASQVGEARRVVSDLARRSYGFGEHDAAQAALLATELATNLVKHADDGMLLVGRTDHTPGLDLIALDRGRGMPDVARCLEDGFSTAGSAGTGLGAVVRVASLVDIYTRPNGGTALLARLLPKGHTATDRRAGRFGSVSLALPGESACGDTWACAAVPDGTRLLVADGLGHGPLAAQAASEASRIFALTLAEPLEAALDTIHKGMRATRGAAVALGDVRPAERRVLYAGIGNIGATIASHTGRRMLVSLNGTVGHTAPRIRAFEYEWPSGGVLLMYTDGLRSGWDPGPYGDLLSHHPAVVACVLVRDFWRRRDDVTVTVFREDVGRDA
jgi:anti-sigma regulatory factor (Ser/Thr protein kinase)